MMPVNMRIMQGQFKYQKRITERRDERVELLTELLQGMKLIKLLGERQSARSAQSTPTTQHAPTRSLRLGAADGRQAGREAAGRAQGDPDEGLP
jgi:hypothetical protein